MRPFLLLAITLVPALLLRQCWPMDEIRYLELIREMQERGNLFALTLEGQPYAEKTPFLLWQVMLLGKLTGLDLAARLVPALHTVLLVAAVGKLTRALGGTETTGQRAACFAAVSPGTFFLGQTFLFDLPLAAYALWSDALAVTAIAQGRRVPWSAWLFAGLAVLMKGPVALLHVLPVIALASAHHAGRSALLPRGRWLFAAVLTVLPLAGWALAYVANVPGGWDLLVRQVSGRLSGSHGHQRPWWLYTWVVPVFALPWLFAVRAPGSAPKLAKHLAACALMLVVLFSVMRTRAVQYVYPEVMLLVPLGAFAFAEPGRLANGLVRGLAALVLGVAVAALALPLPSLLAEHGGRNGPVLAVDLAEVGALWPALAALVAAAALLLRTPLATRFALVLLAIVLGAFPLLDRAQAPERSLPVLRDHRAYGGLVVQFLPLYDGNFHWYLGDTGLPVAKDEKDLDRLVTGKDALVFGFEKQLDEEVPHHRLEPVVHETFFFRSFYVWRAIAR